MTDFPPFKKASLYKDPDHITATDKTHPFDFFDSPWFKDATKQLCIDGWPAFIVPLNIGIRQARESYNSVALDNVRLNEIIYQLHSKLKMAEIENSILKINGKAARNKDGI